MDNTSDWGERFDKEFGDYGTWNEKHLDDLETEVRFRLKIKDFIRRERIRAQIEVLEEITKGESDYRRFMEAGILYGGRCIGCQGLYYRQTRLP